MTLLAVALQPTLSGAPPLAALWEGAVQWLAARSGWLTVLAMPQHGGNGYHCFWLPGAIAKGGSARWVYLRARVIEHIIVARSCAAVPFPVFVHHGGDRWMRLHSRPR